MTHVHQNAENASIQLITVLNVPHQENTHQSVSAHQDHSITAVFVSLVTIDALLVHQETSVDQNVLKEELTHHTVLAQMVSSMPVYQNVNLAHLNVKSVPDQTIALFVKTQTKDLLHIVIVQ